MRADLAAAALAAASVGRCPAAAAAPQQSQGWGCGGGASWGATSACKPASAHRQTDTAH